MNRIPLYQRIENALEIGRWMALDDILAAIGSSSKSYVKMTLHAMPNVTARRVLSKKSPVKNTWKWEFCRHE